MPPSQNNLKDFEKACKQTENEAQRELIALEAVNFLIQTTPPDPKIVDAIDQEIDKESHAPGGVPALPQDDSPLNDALCAQLEARLAAFFSVIDRLKKSSDQPVMISLFARAKLLCQRADAWRQYDYWTPLLDFLKNANDNQWRQWRGAVMAQQKARFAVGDSNFLDAKLYAIYGLQNLATIRDHRLYLDLCSRLQNAIAEGPDARWRLASALGRWIIKESLKARHYLRAVGMGHNLGNQFLIAGKNDAAIKVLEDTQQLCNKYWSIPAMSFYAVNLLERLAYAYRNVGDLTTASDYLQGYGAYAQAPREKTLLHLGEGYLALQQGDSQTAEQKFELARQFAQGDSATMPEDVINLWSACMSLALACLRRDPPDLTRAKSYLEKARGLSQTKTDLVNFDRTMHENLMDAAIQIADSADLDQEDMALRNKAKALDSECLDSPRRQIQLRLIRANLHDRRKKPGDDEERDRLRDEARGRAVENRFDPSDLELLLTTIFG